MKVLQFTLSGGSCKDEVDKYVEKGSLVILIISNNIHNICIPPPFMSYYN